MRKRGFVGNWQNRHWAEVYNFFDGDTNNAPNNDKYIPTGELPKQPAGTIAGILERMELFYNTPYVWGGGNRVTGGDCSYYVNYCYSMGGATENNHGSLSSYDIRRIMSIWGAIGEREPKDGMILWRQGHVALYKGGYVYELRSAKLDFQKTAYSTRGKDFAYILYSEKIDYDDVD